LATHGRLTPVLPGAYITPCHRPDGRVAMQRTANPRTAVRFRFRPPPRELLNTGKMRRIPTGLAALGFVVIIGAPLHDAAAEEDASSSRLVPGGYLQPRRVPDADSSPVMKSGLPKPRAAEPEPDPVAAARLIRPRPRIAPPAHHPRPAPVRRAPPSDGKVQF
jgi:hypothetical protein